MTAAEILQAFYNAYAKWLRMGAPANEAIDEFVPVRDQGLCGNLTRFCYTKQVGYDALTGAEALMKQQFIDAGLDGVHPFESSTVYWLRVVSGSIPECLNRIEWAQDHAN